MSDFCYIHMINNCCPRLTLDAVCFFRFYSKKGEAILSEAQGLTFDLLNFEDKVFCTACMTSIAVYICYSQDIYSLCDIQYLRNQTGEQRFLRSGVGMERQIEELEATNLKTIRNTMHLISYHFISFHLTSSHLISPLYRATSRSIRGKYELSCLE